MREEDIKIGMRVVGKDCRGKFKGTVKTCFGYRHWVMCDDGESRMFYSRELTRLVPKRKKLTVVCEWQEYDGHVVVPYSNDIVWQTLVGNRTKLTIEVLDEKEK